MANIIKWRADKNTKITNAEKAAYDRCYDAFSNLDYATNFERASYNVYEAFKENYVDVVSEFVEQGVVQSEWIKPVAIARKNYVSEQAKPLEKSEGDKAQMQEYLEKLKALAKRPSEGDGVGGGA